MTNQSDLVAILDALDAATWTPDTKFEALTVDVDGTQKPAKAELLRMAPIYPDLDQVTRARLLEWITPTEIRTAAPELDIFLKRRTSLAKPEPEPETDWAEAILASPEPGDESLFNPEPEQVDVITEPATVEDMLTDLASIDAELNPEPGHDPEEALEALSEPMELSDLAEAADGIEELGQEEEPKPWADFEELA